MARLDKWLWAARFFRTRSAAQQAVAGGKVRVNGERAKPAKGLRVGDELALQIGATAWTLRVEQLSERRGPATVACTLYSEDEAGRARREEAAALRRLTREPARERAGRPTKRERRELDRWREH
jgi:ribosome-associated heat shock protein Hsp15